MKTRVKGITQEYGAGKQLSSSFLNVYVRHMYASKFVSKEIFFLVCVLGVQLLASILNHDSYTE